MAPDPPSPAPMRSIELPAELVQAIADRIRSTSFDSVDGFVAFVLSRLIEEHGDSPFSEDDERRLKERLRSLGYID